MAHHFQFCPYCGIGLSNSENVVQICKNCKEDFSERSEAEQIEMDDEEDSMWDMDDDYESIDEMEAEENAERAATCKCGAWVFDKHGNGIHVADCCCGA